MDLHQYQRYKKPNPLLMIVGIIILIVIIIIMAKNMDNSVYKFTPVSVNVNISIEDSQLISLPLVFLMNKEIIYFTGNMLKKDTVIHVKIISEKNIIEVLDNTKSIKVSGVWNYTGDDGLTLYYRIGRGNKPELLIGN